MLRLVVLGLDLVWSGTTGAARLILERETAITPVHGQMNLLRPFAPHRKRRSETEDVYQQCVAAELHDWIVRLVNEHTPGVLAIEVTDWHSPHTGRDRKVQRALGRAEGVVGLTAALLTRDRPHLSYVQVGAQQVKQIITGRSNATKRLVADKIRTLYPGLPFPQEEIMDCYDAAAVAHTAAMLHLQRKKHKEKV